MNSISKQILNLSFQKKMRNIYLNNKPFKYIVIDNF